MKSYVSIDRIEGKYAVCEVELLTVKESKPEDFATKETAMMDVPLKKFPKLFGKVREGDIFIVEHDGKNVSFVYFKSEKEKHRRLEVLRNIMK